MRKKQCSIVEFSFSFLFVIKPVKREINEASPKNSDTNKVGNLGTRPIRQYSMKTGMNRITATSANKRESSPKNNKGRYSSKRVKIVFNTRMPSL